jgi:two-component system NtrC family sensor kinase
MLGYSELLGTTELSNDQRALTDKISLQARRIRTLVASLLSFAKQAPAAKSDLDLNVVVQTALKLCQSQVQAARVQPSVNLEESLPKVRGDSNQLLQVFSHIINNAVHAMSDRGDGTLTVCTRNSAGMIIVEFSDDGPGMSDPAKVFDPFYTTRPVGQGTGLGLSMCYGIIEGHGGKISCRNRSEGGASFLIELPAALPASADKAHAHAAKL